jgi:general secretion pathway protein B
MSTILKALQKVEGKRQAGETPVPEDLPLFEKSGSGRHGTRPLLLLLLLVAGMLIGAGGWQAYNRLTAGVANPTLSGSGEGNDATLPPLSQGAPEAVSRTPDVPSEVGPAIAASAEGPANSPTPQRTANPSPAKTAAGRRTRLVVSGIAYQEDRKGRFAVVNDRPMGEGEEIDGAVVTAILEDRVRFFREGETFEIGLRTKERPRK